MNGLDQFVNIWNLSSMSKRQTGQGCPSSSIHTHLLSVLSFIRCSSSACSESMEINSTVVWRLPKVFPIAWITPIYTIKIDCWMCVCVCVCVCEFVQN